MKQIIAIGGGGFGGQSVNLAIEKYLLLQTRKKNPSVGFLPQASNEAPEYIVRFYDTFLNLGARPFWISFFGKVEASWEERLLNADLIYVGGGNTRSMLALWKEWGVDRVLLQAYNQGTVLAGVSAGAICWFEQGITDSVWPLGMINGLGFLSGSVCPHFDSELERSPVYREKIKKNEILPGIALEDYTAAHYKNGQLFQVIKSEAHKKAWLLARDKEEIIDGVSLL
ncbi:Peptidase E [Legionella adelaidensis]|uniref:Peptidase E n=1 Tax=Legionella adelaidensis TaxID=45056 RepID=A0A0W0R3W2_9GAMM|nr:peptidase E [Legionella adelaidensis]KTC65760.1 Peptidase E [Legionella adelaidensis]